MQIDDPGMPTQPKEARNYLLACYAVSLIQGGTILGTPIRHQTVVNYLTAAYTLLRDRKLRFDSKEDYIATILTALNSYEDVADRRNMITDGMTRWFVDQSKKDGPDSAMSAITDWIILGRYAGFRSSEWCQLTQSSYARVDAWPGQPSLAFTRDDITFLGRNERRLTDDDIRNLSIEHFHHFSIRWRKQKNKENGQEIDFARDDINIDYCALRAARRIYLRSLRQQSPAHEPLATFSNKSGKRKFITSAMVTAHLRTAASTVLHINTGDRSLALWSPHSIRVTAANLLHRANLSDSYIQTRLRWKSKSFLMYLRNTIYAADAHTKALNINLGQREASNASYRAVQEPHEALLTTMRAQ